MRSHHFLYGLIIFLTNGICFADNGIEDGGADQRGYIKGSSITVLLNYNQFVSTGMVHLNPTLTQKNLEAAVHMVVDRWVQVSGLNLKITYGGTTTETTPGEGEVLIGAEVDADGPGRQASTEMPGTDDVTNGRSHIRFFRRADGSEINWHVFNFKDYPFGATFFHSILMHEFGHALGLQHNENTDGNANGEVASMRTVMQSGSAVHASYGPFIEDVEDLIALYGPRPNVKFDVNRSSNDGLSWASTGSNIPVLGTSQTPVVNLDDDRMTLFLTNLAHHPAFIMANNQGQGWSSGPTDFRTVRSLYGATGSGFGNEYMMAWVDPDQKNYVTIVYTNDGGSSWVDRSPGFRAASAPSLRKVDNNTWIISYVYLDENMYANENGRILTRVSTNAGVSWGPAAELVIGMRAIGGVTVTSTDRNHIRIGFVQTNDADDRWTTTITSIAAHINSNNTLSRDNWATSVNQATMTEASFTATSRVFVLGYKTPDLRLSSCNRDFSNEFWQTCAFVNPFTYRDVPPAVAAKTNSSLVYMVHD